MFLYVNKDIRSMRQPDSLTSNCWVLSCCLEQNSCEGQLTSLHNHQTLGALPGSLGVLWDDLSCLLWTPRVLTLPWFVSSSLCGSCPENTSIQTKEEDLPGGLAEGLLFWGQKGQHHDCFQHKSLLSQTACCESYRHFFLRVLAFWLTWWPGLLAHLVTKRHPPCYILGISTLGSTKGFPKVVTPCLSLGEWAQQVTKKQQQLSQESSWETISSWLL